MPYDIIIVGGDITILPIPGDPLRVIYEFVDVQIRPGICHFEFKPTSPILPPGGMLPTSISVHFLPKTEAFPTDPIAVKSIQRAYGLEPAKGPDTLVPDFIPSTVVGVSTINYTSASGLPVDGHWQAVVTYPS